MPEATTTPAPTAMTREEVAALQQQAAQLAARLRRRDQAVKLSRDLYDASGSSRRRADKRRPWRGMFGVEFDQRAQENARSLSRELYRNSSAYRAPLKAAVDEIIGDGLLPIGRTEAAKRACRMFRDWAGDKARCDIRRTHTLGELQRMAMLGALKDGDQLELFTTTGAVQQIPSHRIVNPHRGTNRPRLAGGIATDEYGAPVEFWIAPWTQTGLTLDYQRATAYDARWASFLNCPDDDFEGLRTPPLLIAAMLRVQDVEEYTDKVSMAAKWAAAISGFITTGDPGAVNAMLDEAHEAEAGTGTASDDDEVVLGDGLFHILPEGSDIRQVQGQQPMASFDGFLTTLLRMACAGIRMPYEICMLDYSNANFSTARQIQMQAERFAKPWRQMFVQRRVLPEYRWKVAQWTAEGLLPASREFQIAAMDVEVPPPPHRVNDPQKENAASVMGLEHNLETLEEYHAKRGRDWRQVLQQRAAEHALARELGIPQAASFGPGSPGAPQPGNEDRDNEERAPTPPPAPSAAKPQARVEAAIQEDIQDTALNGAQIASLKDLAKELVTRQLPREAFVEIVSAAFPTLGAERIGRIADSLEAFKPPQDPTINPDA